MSNINAAITSILKAHSGLSSLIGDRIYALTVPQNATLPCLSYFTVSREKDYTHEGDSHFITQFIQIDCWAENEGTCRAVAKEVVSALSGYYGISENTTIDGVFEEIYQELFENATKDYHIVLEFRVMYHE